MPSSFSSSSSTSSSSLSRSSLFTFCTSPHAMDHRGGIEQLHFDVPLISTRRSTSANASKSSRLRSNQDDYIDTSRSVPFSWEAAPGVPKGTVRRTDSSKEEEEEVFSTPKPPPGLWRPPNRRNDREQHNNADADNECSNGSSSDDLVLNATVLDKVSLSESLDTACRFRPGANKAPSFIMSRFLPAANALAAASLDKYSQQRRTPPLGSREQRAPVKLRRRQRGEATYAAAAAKVPMEHGYNVRRTNAWPATPSSGCGLVELFPSSLKSVICRFKSPVRCQTPKIATLEAFAQRSRRIGASDGLSSEDGLSSKACKSPGWGLPLLDTSRVRIRGAGVDLEKDRRLVDGKKFRDGGRTPRTTAGDGRPLPMLKTPTDPWLAHALNYANSKY